MTYGVTRCRMCGKPINPPDGKAMDRYRRSLNGKPLMTEPEWRAAGFKAAPTRRQMLQPREGTCFECQFKVGMRVVPIKKLFFSVLAVVVFIMALVFLLGSIFT